LPIFVKLGEVNISGKAYNYVTCYPNSVKSLSIFKKLNILSCHNFIVQYKMVPVLT
jgi:hypothetical protein